MNISASDLPARLCALSNDELADLALGGQLPSDDRSSLQRELARRGIHDLDAFTAERRQRRAQLKAEADARLAAHGEVVRSRILLGLCFYVAAAAAALWVWLIGHQLSEALVIVAAATLVTPAYIAYWRLRHLLLVRLLQSRHSAF